MERFRLIISRGAWAPTLVILVHQFLVLSIGHHVSFDPYFHFAGGLAGALFIDVVVEAVPDIFGKPSPLGLCLFAFTGVCTAALFWEFVEFGSDELFHTHIQISVRETLGDLALGATGAAAFVALSYVRRARKRSRG